MTQLMTCMDESHRVAKPDDTKNTETTDGKPGYLLVIGETNRPDAVDPALRRPGRFDREIALGVPNESARIKILTVLTQSLKLEGAFDLVKISKSTPGFVGADLKALVNKAGNLAMKRIIDGRKVELSIENEDWWKMEWTPEEMEKLSITMSDFEVLEDSYNSTAINFVYFRSNLINLLLSVIYFYNYLQVAAKLVQPSSRREGFSSIPNVKWEDVGGLDQLRREFDRYIVRRIKYPDEYEVNIVYG